MGIYKPRLHTRAIEDRRTDRLWPHSEGVPALRTLWAFVNLTKATFPLQ